MFDNINQLSIQRLDVITYEQKHRARFRLPFKVTKKIKELMK